MRPARRRAAAAARRVRQARRVLRADGPGVLWARLARRALLRTGVERPELLVRAEDVLRADPARPVPAAAVARTAERGLTVNWVMTPPAGGSGGHTTVFRLVTALEERGHTCRVYLKDRYLGDTAGHEATLRAHWPAVRAAVADAEAGIAPADAIFATSWNTAYQVAVTPQQGKRFYLVQDYEPAFYALGSESQLAENTYRLGLHGVTAGRWLSTKLAREFGMACDAFDFGCDTTVYRCDNLGERDGVVFYARPSAPRRAYELGVMALELFARRHPETPIHLFGERVGALPFRFTDHGLLSTAELNALYNRCAAALSLSLTNISLIPLELLAAGCIPVVNDAHHNRMVVDNPYVRYAPPTPHDLARALSEVVQRRDTAGLARAASASVSLQGWDQAGDTLERVLRRELDHAAERRATEPREPEPRAAEPRATDLQGLVDGART